MKKHSLCSLLIAFTFVPTALMAESPNKTVLPDDFKIYYNEKMGLSRTAFKGAHEKILPMNNDYKDAPGCYVACYAKDAKLGTYRISDSTYIMGQVRVKGGYHNALCIPTGFEHKDLRTSKDMKEVCEKAFPAMCEKEKCWVDGKTSEWFNYN